MALKQRQHTSSLEYTSMSMYKGGELLAACQRGCSVLLRCFGVSLDRDFSALL